MKGFTIIEVLAVTMILAILAAVAMPQYRKAMEHSRTAEPPIVWNFIEKMARLSMPGGTFSGSGDEMAVCNRWYKDAGLTSLGSNCFAGKSFVYCNTTCGPRQISMQATRTNNPTTPSATGGLYSLTYTITKNGFNISTTHTCEAGSLTDACQWFN